MTSQLARLCGGSPRQRLALLELRKLTRDDSDIRLVADMRARAHSVVRQLGLDPRDATATEIYQALIAAAPRVEQLAYFKDTEWVLAEFDGQILSFHPVDVINNYHYQLPLGQHQLRAARRGLGYEIHRRFRRHARAYAPMVARIVCEGGICDIIPDGLA